MRCWICSTSERVSLCMEQTAVERQVAPWWLAAPSSHFQCIHSLPQLLLLPLLTAPSGSKVTAWTSFQLITELTHSDKQPSTLTLTVTDSLELPISLMRKSPDCRRKLDIQERTHPRRGTETTCKHQEGPRQNWSLGPRQDIAKYSFGRDSAR